MRFFVCLIWLLQLALPSLTRAEDTTVKVGFIAALTGPAQAFGQAARNGFQLALRDHPDRSIRAVFEDDQFIPSKTISAFNKLVHVDHVDVVVNVGSATLNAIAPLAEARNVPLIGWASDPSGSKNRRFVIRSYPSGAREGARAGEEVTKRKMAKLGVISAVHDYPIAWRAGLFSVVSEESILLDEQVPPDTHDFRPLLLQARQREIENFALCIMPGQIGVLARQSHEIGMKPNFGGCEFLQDENEAKAANGALRGAWYIEVPISPPFAARYRQEFGNENAIAGAAIHYDLFQILTLAAKDRNTSNLARNIMALDHVEGVTGTIRMRNDDGDQFFDYDLVAKEVHTP